MFILIYELQGKKFFKERRIKKKKNKTKDLRKPYVWNEFSPQNRIFTKDKGTFFKSSFE